MQRLGYHITILQWYNLMGIDYCSRDDSCSQVKSVTNIPQKKELICLLNISSNDKDNKDQSISDRLIPQEKKTSLKLFGSLDHNATTNNSTVSDALILQKEKTPSKLIEIVNDKVRSAKFAQFPEVNLARSIADKVSSLVELKQAILDFDRCALKQLANNTVFADGNSSAKVMLIGEAPGVNEDRQGIPFCGESGKLLDLMLETIGLNRKENFYITNTVFWRPPGNRQPTEVEIEVCRPFVEKHIAIIKPQLLILVGGTAAGSLLGSGYSQITKVRGYYAYTNKYLQAPITTTAIFHPAYLLRQPQQKKLVWFDLLKIRNYLEKTI